MGGKLLRLAGAAGRFLRAFDEDRVAVYAGEAAFFVLASAVPFAMLFVLIFGAFSPLEPADMLLAMREALPAPLWETGERLVGEVFAGFSAPLASVTGAAMFWSASKGVRAVGEGLQNIFDEDRRRHYVKNIFVSCLFTLLFGVMIAAAFFILVVGEPIAELAGARLGLEGSPFAAVLNIRSAVLFPMLTLLFALAYRLLARSAIPLARQLFGAALAAGGWLAYSYFFALYVEHFSNYSYIYGSLAALMVFMLWLYACMNILLTGALINKLRENRRKNVPEADGEAKEGTA